MKPPRIHDSWKPHLEGEFQQPYMQELKAHLIRRLDAGAKIFPAGAEYFAALNYCPFSSVKVVLLGQDPYHGPGQAHGLSFSVRKGVPPPPSLVNIYKELSTDVGFQDPGHGFLLEWAQQGVLLLNSVLTVEMGRPGSHAGKGWERFTDQIIAGLNEDPAPKVFLLWGSYAQKKGQHIDGRKHLVIKSAHPSPLSAYRGFFGSRPFSKCNEFLKSRGREPIQWQLTPANQVKTDPLSSAIAP